MSDISWSPYVVDTPPVTLRSISALENGAKLHLPADYVAVVRAHAGQVCDREVALVGSGSTIMGPLFFIHDDRDHPKSGYNVYRALDDINGWLGADNPAHGKYVPFSSNTSTGYFCFDYTRDEQNPSVVFIDLGYDPDGEGAIIALANGFSEFLKSLR